MQELKPFEDDLFNLVKNIQFRPINNQFQDELKKNVTKIHTSNNIIVKGDKSRNLYQIPLETYTKVMNDNITQTYKKCSTDNVKNVNKEAAVIAKSFKIEDRVEKYTECDAFVTIKDHKVNFQARPEYRLINPAKSNLGRVSKQILEKVVTTIKSKLNLKLWANSTDVINWFNKLEDKHNLKFFKFDIVSFYPSISQKLYDESITWATQFHSLSESEVALLSHCRQSFLFFKNETWVKKGDTNFDITMGAFDGAEVCEVVGLFMLNKMLKLFDASSVGLYRDDGLAAVKGSGPQLEKLRKQIYTIFENHGLKITSESNIVSTEFLDIVLDLSNESYKPYRKNNDIPVYINQHSNHPKAIKRELPKMIEKRISNLISSEQMFKNEVGPYQDAINNAGYKAKLEYTKTNNAQNEISKKSKRTRKVVWFNPPFSDTVSTNVAEKFLKLIDKHFKHTNLHRLFNRSSVKVSYSCLPNIQTIINGHNKRILREEAKRQQDNECNCRGGIEYCPISGKCLTKNVVYKAQVQTRNKTHSYIGQASTSFKTRFTNHIQSFNHSKYSNTSLSKFIWQLKDAGTPYNLNWNILAKSTSYTSSSGKCQLCNMEKTMILFSSDENLLNKRSELLNKCRHKEKTFLSNG